MRWIVIFSLCTVFIQVHAQNELPVMLDDIHYYVSDRKATNDFFIKNFNAKPMAQQPINPFKFIDFLEIRRGQSTINISGLGPFEGMVVKDTNRWKKEIIPSGVDMPPMYGIHWVAFGTKYLDSAIKKFQTNGVKFVSTEFRIHYKPNTRAALCYGPDYNLILLIENKNDDGNTLFYIDHLLYLTENINASIHFFKNLYGAQIQKIEKNISELLIGKHTFFIAEPELLNINRTIVLKRASNKFRYGIDHLGFLYADIQQGYSFGKKNGIQFLQEPVRMNYFQQPTIYQFAFAFTPDRMQMELYQEDGRTEPRKMYLETVNKN